MIFSIAVLGLVSAGPGNIAHIILMLVSRLKYSVRQTFVDLSNGFLSSSKQPKPWGYIYTHEDCPIGKYSLHLIR